MRILEPMMLLLMAQEPVHGYGLLERLTETFGVSDLPPQTVYRALQDMESQGWIVAEWDMDSAQGPPRKVYTITDIGLASLEAWSGEIEILRRMLETFLDRHRQFQDDQREHS
jgi:DNA-binding PadR family transcriptional regulator